MANARERAVAARVLRDANHAPDDIADLLGVSLSQVYRYLNGEVEPKPAPTNSALEDLEKLLETQELDEHAQFQAGVARRLATRLDKVSVSDKAQDALAMPQIAKELRAVVAAIMDVSQDDKEWLAGLFSKVGNSKN